MDIVQRVIIAVILLGPPVLASVIYVALVSDGNH